MCAPDGLWSSSETHAGQVVTGMRRPFESSSLKASVLGPNDGHTVMRTFAWRAWMSSTIFFGSGNVRESNFMSFQCALSPQYCQSWTIPSSEMPSAR